MILLCQYCKQTDIYYSTRSFENVAKNCQFQFLDPSKLPVSVFRPPQILLPVSELPVSVFRPPPKYCCQFQNYQCQFLDPPPKLPVSVFRHPPKYCCQFQFLDPPKLPVSVFRPPQILLPFSIFRSPPNIVKGNGVVFENFTINNF